MKRTIVLLLFGLAAAVPVFSAPAPKEGKAELGPITDAMLETTTNNLKQMGIALHNYNDTFGVLATNHLSKDKKPLLSWRVQLLPFLEGGELYKQFKLDEPWDSDHNKKLIEKIPAVYKPVRGKPKAGMTYYQVVAGSNGAMKGNASIPATFPDGTSNTFMVVEAEKAVIWTKPEDLEYDGKTVPKLGGMFDGRFHALFADGHVARFKKDVKPEILGLLIDPKDGQPLPEDIGEDK